MNDQIAGNVVGDGGVLRATLKFFAWADKNHMPIRRMIVDFGDGGEYDATDGPYPNRRGYKDAQLKDSYCDNSNFGQSSDACSARPISIEHTYQCVRGKEPEWDSNENRGAGACVFHPRVYVEDNWGYCTGTCGNSSSAGGTMCYNTDAASHGECDPNGTISANKPWIDFGGKVIVLPP